jgi:hypothetical protein
MLVTRQIKELLTVESQLGPDRTEIFFHQPQREFIVACRDRRMRSKDILSARLCHSGFKIVTTFDQFTRPLQG